MYLSRVHLTNWRSYGDAEFDFHKPSRSRPLILIGAKNGCGKTSFLMALYLGLFGRFGLRHVEGQGNFDLSDISGYRNAIQKFRRNTASADEPTAVELVFSPTANEDDLSEIRVVRRWYFNSAGHPKAGDSFESVDLYIDNKPQQLHTGIDAAHDRLERHLFPAQFMPAFFFDGEQAQSLINNSGGDAIKKSVEVLFGTRILSELHDQIRNYVNSTHNKHGGRTKASSQHKDLELKKAEREALAKELEEQQRQAATLQQSRRDLEKSQRDCQEQLARLGGERKNDVEIVHSQVSKAEAEKLAAEKAVTEIAKNLGLAMAVSRLVPAIANRLDAEGVRERWETLREGTLIRTEEVLQVALPEPAEDDDLLGNLSASVRDKVRERFRKAIEQIYNPPPDGCADDFVLGHAKGEFRVKLVELLDMVRSFGSADIAARTRRLKEARDRLEDALAKRNRLGELPQEVDALSKQLTDLGAQIAEVSRHLGAIENQIKANRSKLQDLGAEIGRLLELIAKLEPEQRRVAVAERVHGLLDTLEQELKPITLQRLECCVTRHFTRIADERFRKGRIVFPDTGSPLLTRSDHPDALIEMMSGFERRSFGIAFSLALAEMTRMRLPLVVDTPLGNADSEYRSRLLKAMTDVDLDQIIILTHDAEVTGQLFEQIESQVRETFLVEYQRKTHESVVHPNSYFEGIGR